MRWSLLRLTVLGIFTAAMPGFAADGDVDPTFGVQGKLVLPVNRSSVMSMAVQPDGDVLVVFRVPSGSDFGLDLRRYASDGTPDATFGTAGSVIVTLPATPFAARVLVQSDGKIVVVGYVDSVSDDDVFLLRYNAAGALDASFGTGGIVIVSGPERISALDASLQADGKIVTVGYSVVTGPAEDALLMRFDTDGALDATFGSGGQVLTDLTTFDVGYAVTVQADGALVIGGQTSAGGLLARYESDGTLDATFGTGGAVTVGVAGTAVFGVAAQAGGGIVAGSVKSAVSRLTRFDSSGALDGTFGSGGSVIVPLDTTSPHLGAQSDGKLLVAGTIANTHAVIRFDEDGEFDPTLSVCGAAITAFEGDNMSLATAFAVQPDDRFLLASQVPQDQNNLQDLESYAAIARFGTPAATVCTPAATGKSRLTFKGFGMAKWKWTGAGALADFGTPDLGTDVALCVLDAATGAPHAVLAIPGTTSFCDHATCWHARANGFTGVRSGLVLGKLRMKLILSSTGAAKLVVSNKNATPYLGSLAAYPQPLPLTARMKRGDGGACWEANYSIAVKNSAETGFLAFAD